MKDLENNGKLIIDPVASKIVKRIFMLTLDGMTAKEIADLFNKEEIKTPSEYLKVKGLEDRTKKVWTRTIITRILGNEVYTGKCCRGKSQKISYKTQKRIYVRREDRVVTEDSHEAIISQEIFDAVHNNKKYGMVLSEIKEFDTKFLDYMYCAECKEKFVRRRSRNYTNIHCKSRNESDLLCKNNELYKYEYIEKLIINTIKKEMNLFFNNKNVSISLTQKYNEIKIKEIENNINEANKELGFIRFKISKVYNDRLLEKINENEYSEKYKSFIQTRNELNQQIEKLKEEEQIIIQQNDDVSRYNIAKEILTKMENNRLTREDIGELIDNIEISADTINIHYNFLDKESDIISCHF